MLKKEINNIVEALLFASPEPFTQAQLNSVLEPDPSNPESTDLNIISDLLLELT